MANDNISLVLPYRPQAPEDSSYGLYEQGQATQWYNDQDGGCGNFQDGRVVKPFGKIVPGYPGAVKDENDRYRGADNKTYEGAKSTAFWGHSGREQVNRDMAVRFKDPGSSQKRDI